MVGAKEQKEREGLEKDNEGQGIPGVERTKGECRGGVLGEGQGMSREGTEGDGVGGCRGWCVPGGGERVGVHAGAECAIGGGGGRQQRSERTGLRHNA